MGAAAIASRRGWGASWRFCALLALAVTSAWSRHETADYEHAQMSAFEIERLEAAAFIRVATVLHVAVGAMAYLALAATGGGSRWRIRGARFGRQA